MTKEIIVVFQDCALCGARGKQKIADLAAKGVTIRKVSFISDEGRELCAEAVKKGIGVMPFYVDGDDFATNIEALITKKPANKQKKTQKVANSTAKKQINAKEKNNGDDSKA